MPARLKPSYRGAVLATYVAELIINCIVITAANDDNLYALVNNRVTDAVFANVHSARSGMSRKVFTVVWKWFPLEGEDLACDLFVLLGRQIL